MSDGERVVELKDATRSFRLTLQDVETIWNVGVRTGKEAEMWLYFDDGRFVVKCQIEKLKP